ncbi:MAG: toll/interleukin-1 receptor domain-containing protein [Terricaulis sp.]
MISSSFPTWLIAVASVALVLGVVFGIVHQRSRWLPRLEDWRRERERLVRDLAGFASAQPFGGGTAAERDLEFAQMQLEISHARGAELERLLHTVGVSVAPVPAPSRPAPHAIFVGYRRKDSIASAGRIYDRLQERFGREHVFKDVDSIDFGVPFAEYIASVIQQCRVFLALIGPDWLSELRHRSNDMDYVLIELELALSNPHMKIIPILLPGAAMPDAAELPTSISRLSGLQSAEVRHDPDFHGDITKLIKGIEALLPERA